MDFKKEYIKMRNSGSYELQFFFNYYLSKGGYIKDPNEFTETFMFTHVEQPMVAGYPPMKVRVGEIDREQVLEYMDKIFGLTTLRDKELQFLKVVE